MQITVDNSVYITITTYFKIVMNSRTLIDVHYYHYTNRSTQQCRLINHSLYSSYCLHMQYTYMYIRNKLDSLKRLCICYSYMIAVVTHSPV